MDIKYYLYTYFILPPFSANNTKEKKKGGENMPFEITAEFEKIEDAEIAANRLKAIVGIEHITITKPVFHIIRTDGVDHGGF